MIIRKPELKIFLSGLAMIFEGIVKVITLGAVRPGWSFRVLMYFMK